MRHATSPIVLMLLAVMLVGLGGCSFSADRQVFESTQTQPTNVAVIDTTQDRVLWRMEVPVEHKVELDFDRPGLEREATRISQLPATSMTWKLYPIAKPYSDPNLRVGEAIAHGEVQLTGNPVRMQINYRKSAAISGEGLYRIEQYRRPEGVKSSQQAATTQPANAMGAPTTQPGAEQPAPIVGKWNARGKTPANTQSITFSDDGTLRIIEADKQGNESETFGTYQMNDETLTMNRRGAEPVEFKYNLHDDVLILQGPDGNEITLDREPFDRP